MIKASQFLETCLAHNFDFFTGTPCSYLKPLINATIDTPSVNYFAATNEGDAVAMACGAFIAGKKGIVMFQNSGLGNAVNALTSLAYPFRLPCLLIVTHRGEPGGKPDEPQHELMGPITTDLLDVLKIKWESFPEEPEQIQSVLKNANDYINERQLPYALVMSEGSVAAQELQQKKDETPIGSRQLSFTENLTAPYSKRTSRTEALQVLLEHKQPGDIVIASTGKAGRELYTLQDAPEHLYMVGSMGSAPALALGIALNYSKGRVITVDGDGALLMRMGNLASIGIYRPPNFIHLLLDNEVHDSTGGQGSFSENVSFAPIAEACGYTRVCSTDDLDQLESFLSQSPGDSGPTFIHFRIKKGSPKTLGRPKVKPFEVKERLMRHLGTMKN
jgi:phosphonopyruvate decarboxylase